MAIGLDEFPKSNDPTAILNWIRGRASVALDGEKEPPPYCCFSCKKLGHCMYTKGHWDRCSDYMICSAGNFKGSNCFCCLGGNIMGHLRHVSCWVSMKEHLDKQRDYWRLG